MSLIAVLLLTVYLFPGAASGQQVSAGAASSGVEPAELVQLRVAYQARLDPLREKLKQSIKARTLRYAADLEAIEKQTGAAGKLDAVLSIKKEREIAQTGEPPPGFDAKEREVPSSARQLRSTYEGELARIRSNAAPDGRSLALAYVQQLQALERKLTSANDLPAAQMVKTERDNTQRHGLEPLTPSPMVAGDWMRGADRFTIKEDGTWTRNDVKGTWVWVDAKARTLEMRWENNPKWVDFYILSADGRRLDGHNVDKTQSYKMERTQ